ncbi:hypothetical protein EDD52_1653, partial [Primorskyibacter sedentarius]
MPKSAFGFLLFVASLLVFGHAAQAQQRWMFNPSFERFSNGTTIYEGWPVAEVPPSTYVIASDDYFAGWKSTNGQIEAWASGFQGVPANDRDYFVELNPSEPVGLYQEVCLFNGEELSWLFYHRARNNTEADDPQTALYEVTDLNGNLVQSLASQTTFQDTNTWVRNAGATTYTGPTGFHRLQFRSNSNDSRGNFLDSIRIRLLPVVSFRDNSPTSGPETSSANVPQVVVFGEVLTPFTVEIQVTGGTATEGVDYDLTSTTVTIPPGEYDGNDAASFFSVPLTIYTDAISEPDETIELSLGAITAATDAAFGQNDCTPGLTQAQHIIEDVPPPVAEDDDLGPVNGLSGGDTGSVLGNDSLDGAALAVDGSGVP